MLSKLDQVSGDLNALHRLMTSGDKNASWSREEDDMIGKSADVLRRFKGEEAVEMRKNYLAWKGK